MSRTDYNVAGLHQSHDPLSTNGRARLMRLAAWHLSQAPDNWPLETSAPWIEIDENRKFVFAFRSVRDHDADSAIGAELGLAHLKARRPCGPGIDADPDPGACSLWAFAEAFSGTTHTVGLRLGFFGALDTLQATGCQVGVISHVEGFAERIGAVVEVRPIGGGQSRLLVRMR